MFFLYKYFHFIFFTCFFSFHNKLFFPFDLFSSFHFLFFSFWFTFHQFPLFFVLFLLIHFPFIYLFFCVFSHNSLSSFHFLWFFVFCILFFLFHSFPLYIFFRFCFSSFLFHFYVFIFLFHISKFSTPFTTSILFSCQHFTLSFYFLFFSFLDKQMTFFFFFGFNSPSWPSPFLLSSTLTFSPFLSLFFCISIMCEFPALHYLFLHSLTHFFTLIHTFSLGCIIPLFIRSPLFLILS